MNITNIDLFDQNVILINMDLICNQSKKSILSLFHKVQAVFSEACWPIVRGVTTNYYHGFDW